jgi:hypothetical protein
MELGYKDLYNCKVPKARTSNSQSLTWIGLFLSLESGDLKGSEITVKASTFYLRVFNRATA